MEIPIPFTLTQTNLASFPCVPADCHARWRQWKASNVLHRFISWPDTARVVVTNTDHLVTVSWTTGHCIHVIFVLSNNLTAQTISCSNEKTSGASRQLSYNANSLLQLLHNSPSDNSQCNYASVLVWLCLTRFFLLSPEGATSSFPSIFKITGKKINFAPVASMLK